MRRLLSGVSILLLAIASVASADPVTLTSGSIVTYWDGSDTSFNVAGPGFAAGGSSVGGGFAIAFNVGDTLAFDGTLAVRPGQAEVSPGAPNGSITTGGRTQEGFFGGTFQYTATPFVVGLVPGDNVTFSTPFTGQGTVQLFAKEGDPQPLISQAVRGSGVLSFEAEQRGTGHYNATTSVLNLTFEPAASPTPEPASLLLLGTGLAAAWRSRRLLC